MSEIGVQWIVDATKAAYQAGRADALREAADVERLARDAVEAWDQFNSDKSFVMAMAALRDALAEAER